MKVYIAGPINGYPDGNRAAFATAYYRLVSLGHIAINPHAVPFTHTGECRGQAVSHSGHRYGCFMVPDLHALLDCDGYTLLEGWERSQGATVEEAVARICGKTYVEL